MALSTNLLSGLTSGTSACRKAEIAQEWSLTRRHESENIFGVQVAASSVDTITQCAELLSENINVDFIDINAGCPIDLIYNKGMGASLVEHKRLLQVIFC